MGKIYSKREKTGIIDKNGIYKTKVVRDFLKREILEEEKDGIVIQVKVFN